MRLSFIHLSTEIYQIINISRYRDDWAFGLCIIQLVAHNPIMETK